MYQSLYIILTQKKSTLLIWLGSQDKSSMVISGIDY